jgi:hypothetical protein
MKSQMQIVQEAIARLEQMSRDDFVESLIESGLVASEPVAHEVFSRSVRVVDTVEVVRTVTSLDIAMVHTVAGKDLSFAF